MEKITKDLPGKKELVKDIPKDNFDYAYFKDVSKEDLAKGEFCQVTLEKREYNGQVTILCTVEIHKLWKKVIKSTSMLDERKYNLIVLSRPDFNENEVMHVAVLPIRYLQRTDDEGEVKYQRIEVMFSRKHVLSDFIDYTDADLIEALDLKINWIPDKDSSEQLSLLNAEKNLVYFQ